MFDFTNTLDTNYYKETKTSPFIALVIGYSIKSPYTTLLSLRQLGGDCLPE